MRDCGYAFKVRRFEVREIMINSEDFRHVAEAVVNYRNGRDRLEDSVLVIADHIRVGRRHIVDSLSSGESAKWNADDALMKELVTQVLVAVQIVMENKSHVKYRIREAKADEARRIADTLFNENKERLVNAERDEWLEFNTWRQQKANGGKKGKTKTKGRAK